MGRATMTVLMNTWMNEATQKDTMEEVAIPKSSCLALLESSLLRSNETEDKVVPTCACGVEESSNVDKVVVLLEGEEISELSFSKDSPLKMTFVTNVKKMKLLPCKGKVIVLCFGSVTMDGVIKDKNTMNEFLKGNDIMDGVEL